MCDRELGGAERRETGWMYHMGEESIYNNEKEKKLKKRANFTLLWISHVTNF